MNLVKYFSILLCFITSSIALAKNCVKGIPCGRTCIAAWKTCHIPPSYQRISETVSTEDETNSSNTFAAEVEGEKYLVLAVNGTSIALKDRSGRARGWTIYCSGGAIAPKSGSILQIIPGYTAITEQGQACKIFP